MTNRPREGLYAPLPRWTVVPTVITVLLLAGALFVRGPFEALDSLADVSNARLAFSPAYLALDPVCRLLDALSLLSPAQHLALGATLFGGGLVWSLHRRDASSYAALAIVGAAIASVYAIGIFMPRPMTALSVDAADVLKIDFHSHTNASHDGRSDFDLERNRAWHAAAGFDAAYVSDHGNWDAIKNADPDTSARVGRTVLLSAMEAGLGRARVVALGPPSVYASALHSNQLDAGALAAAGPREAALVYTVPMPEQMLHSRQPPRIPGLAAIEISDACPRGLEQSRQYRKTLTAWADQLNVALVSASDNHGWGRTAAAWTLMKLPHWQGMRATELADAIENKLRRDGRQATSVVVLRPPAGNLRGWRVIATAPALIWNLARSLTPVERLSWAIYAWGLALLLRFWPRQRREAKENARSPQPAS